MSDEDKFVVAVLFIIVFIASMMAGGAYVSSQNEYRQKALAASLEIAKLQQHSEPCQACRERLDVILGRLERIEKAVKP